MESAETRIEGVLSWLDSGPVGRLAKGFRSVTCAVEQSQCTVTGEGAMTEGELRRMQHIARKLIAKYPDRVPVVVTPRAGCDIHLDKNQYLVPRNLSFGEFAFLLRKRMKLHPSEALFFTIGPSFPAFSYTMGELFDMHRDESGVLNIGYAKESVFG